MEEVETTIAGVHEVGPGTIALDIETPEDFDAKPGQFVKLSLEVNDETVSRTYSISSPDTEGTFETTVEVDEEGTLSPKLAASEAGETVLLTGPFGGAHYENEDDVVVIAGGPGIGPAVAIAERVQDEKGSIGIIYKDDTPAHQSRLDTLAEDDVPIHVLGYDESMHSEVEDLLSAEDCVFMYGFADFIDEATAAITDAEADPNETKVESFG